MKHAVDQRSHRFLGGSPRHERDQGGTGFVRPPHDAEGESVVDEVLQKR
jgi:hypothetical protein